MRTAGIFDLNFLLVLFFSEIDYTFHYLVLFICLILRHYMRNASVKFNFKIKISAVLQVSHR